MKTKKKKSSKVQGIVVNPNYDPDSVIQIRSYGVVDLKKYIEKIKKNVKVFEDAIDKEKAEMKKTQTMIDVLENDIKEAKRFKKLKNHRRL